MKKTVSLFLSLILAVFPLASCTSETAPSPSVPTQSDAGSAPDPEADAPETEAPAVPDFAAKLTDHSWFIANPSAVGALTFEGSEASFLLFENGEDKSVSGPVTFAEKSLTIGGEEFRWAVVASFCKLTRGDVSYSLTKTDDADAARGPYNLLTNRWSGDGLTLSFDGGNATLELDGGTGYSGSYELTAGKTLVIHDDAAGGSDVNLALGAKASSSSVETPDFPPEYAVDGDLGTRFSSEYVDPSWLTLDLGSEKRVGAAIVYFETACSADFTFDVSNDGENWTEAASVEGNDQAGVDSPVTVKFPEPHTARYVRFNGLSRATDWGHSIWELELVEGIPGEAECALEYVGERVVLKMDGKTYNLSK